MGWEDGLDLLTSSLWIVKVLQVHTVLVNLIKDRVCHTSNSAVYIGERSIAILCRVSVFERLHLCWWVAERDLSWFIVLVSNQVSNGKHLPIREWKCRITWLCSGGQGVVPYFHRPAFGSQSQATWDVILWTRPVHILPQVALERLECPPRSWVSILADSQLAPLISWRI